MEWFPWYPLEMSLANILTEIETLERRQSNPFKKAENRRRHAALRSLRLRAARIRGTHTEAEWLRLVEACGNVCVRCGGKTIDGTFTKDHILPAARGGCDCIQNIQPMCRNCNSAKWGDDRDYRPRSAVEAVAHV